MGHTQHNHKPNRFGLESRQRIAQHQMRQQENKRDMITVMAVIAMMAVFFVLAASGVI